MTETVSSTVISVDPLTPTVFHEPWWLDIVTEGRWGMTEVAEDGKTVGRLPYFIFKKMGLSIVDMPPLTHFAGPAIVEGVGKPNTRFLRRMNHTLELIRKMPPVSAHYVKCHRGVPDVIAFQTAGFRSSVQFTHEILPQPEEMIWNDLRNKTRNAIRGARKRVSVSYGNDPEAFMSFYKMSFESRGFVNSKEVDVHTRLIGECLARGRGRIYEARDEKGNLDAAIFCAWDKVSSHFLMCSRSLEAHFGTTCLLVWEAILDASRRGLIFDFDGVVSDGGARFANQFTAVVSPRFIALRESVPLRIIRSVRSLVCKKSTFY